MTPTTPIPRAWDRVDDALVGMIAFAEVEQLVARVTESHPQYLAEARQLIAEAPTHLNDAKERFQQVGQLRQLSWAVFRTARGEYVGARTTRRRQRGQLFRLRLWLTWFQVIRPGLMGLWWILTALPRLFWALGRLAARPFRHRSRERLRDDQEGVGPRGRLRE